MELPISLKTAAQVGGGIAAAALIYHGLCLYFQNDITLSFTELVHLPPAVVTAGGNRHQADPSTITIRGKIEVDVRVMRSYRFLLRLTGIVKNEEPTAVVGVACSMPGSFRLASSPTEGGDRDAGAAAGFGGSAALSRHRVMSSFSRGALETNAMSSFVRDDSMSFDRSSSRRQVWSGNQPSILVDSTNEMVDVCGIDISGHICFTPACVMDETLLTYVAAPAPALLSSLSLQSSSAFFQGMGSEVFTEQQLLQQQQKPNAAVLSAALTGGPDGCGNVTVRSCYLQADELARNGMKLSLEVEVASPVHDLQLLIRLPHRRCRFLRADTGGVGSVRQPMKAKRPHRLVWDIGTVEKPRSGEARAAQEGRKTSKHRSKRGKDAGLDSEDGSKATGGADGGKDAHATASEDDAAPPTAKEVRGGDAVFDPMLGFRLLVARCTVVFEQPADLFLDEDDDNSSSDDNGGDGNGSGNDEAEEEAGGYGDGDGGGDGNDQPALGSSRGTGSRRGPSLPSRVRPSGAASAPNHSYKAARRAAKRRQRGEEKRKRREEAVLAGRGSRVKFPSVEITYSTSGLASGTSVKKLQVLSDRPNWEARSVLDRWVLRRVVFGLEKLKLRRFANYTTWFVQPVPVTALSL